jgi:hypothetical protein
MKLIRFLVNPLLFLCSAPALSAATLQFSYPLPESGQTIRTVQIMADGAGGVAFMYTVGPSPTSIVDKIVWLDKHGSQLYVDTVAESEATSAIISVSEKGLVIAHIKANSCCNDGETRVVDNHGQVTLIAQLLVPSDGINVLMRSVFGDAKRFFLWHQELPSEDISLIAYSYP